MTNYKNILAFFILSTLFLGCTEPYTVASENFEEVMVVEGTLTDSLQYQTVRLTKSYPITTKDISYINNAQVWVSDNNNQTFNFNQITLDSTYVSETPFYAEHGNNYTLHILTADGKEYISSSEPTPPKPLVNNAYPEAVVNANGENGVQVYCDLQSPSSEQLFVRYEYEETHKIATPYISPVTYKIYDIVDPYGDADCGQNSSIRYELTLIPRENFVNICYKTEFSSEILLTTSKNYVNGNITHIPIRFIEGESPKLIQKYSILIKAYSENYDAFRFYHATKKQNTSGSTLSPLQPGFIPGNVKNVNTTSERVAGYFNVASLSTKRIFFNGPQLGFYNVHYYEGCEVTSLSYWDKCDSFDQISQRRQLYRLFQRGYSIISYGGGSYTVASPLCSDCSKGAAIIKPNYWED